MDIPKLIAPGPKSERRCCVYKERAIVAERVKMAMGGNKKNPNVIEVIDIACDECPVSGYRVGPDCRGCIAHRCASVCPRGAISFDENHHAIIDPDKCVNCGKCASVCPYSAIQNHTRPCKRASKAPEMYGVEMNTRLIPVGEILVAERICTEHGDIPALAKSIQEHGLINPITVMEQANGGYILIAGLRRLEAVRSLGEHNIRATLLSPLEADEALMLEIAENEQRKEFTVSERLAYADRIKAVEVENQSSGC